MHLSLYVVSALAACSAAFKVPEGATNGFYVAYHDEAGNEVHVKDPDAAFLKGLQSSVPAVGEESKPGVSRVRRSSSGARLFERAATVWCGCTHHLNNIDCDNAVNQIKNQIRNAGGQSDVKPGTAWYGINGNVVSFICNLYGPSNGRMTEATFAGGLSTITSSCGYYVAGTIENDVSDVGYMNLDGEATWFCERTRWSLDHSC
ncbi:hypothetical protein EsH8_V_000881 [Colletotrichum jinshuiense]